MSDIATPYTTEIEFGTARLYTWIGGVSVRVSGELVERLFGSRRFRVNDRMVIGPWMLRVVYLPDVLRPYFDCWRIA